MSQGINLRPWREERRQQRQKRFVHSVAVTVVLGLVISGFFWWSTTQSAAAVEQENQMIQDRLRILEQEIREVTQLREKREALLQRSEVIQSLGEQRPFTIEILDQLTLSMIDGIHLTEMRRDARQISLQGRAAPSQALSSWMRQLSDQPRFGEPILRSLSSADSANTSRFDLMLPLVEGAQ